MPSIKIISDVALYSSLTALSGITTPSINITQSFTSPEITFLGSASGTWDETYTTVRDNSAAWLDGGKDAEVRGLTANWESTTTSVNSNSSNWNEAYTSVSTTSSNWNESYTSTSTNSSNWNEAYTATSTNSSNWNEVYTSVSTTSSNWDSTNTSVNSNSSNWNESYTWVNSNSSTLDVSKIDIGNSHLADDATVKLSVNGNVVIYGDLSATGNTTLVNVTANVTDSLSVVNPGFGVNALTIEQYGPLPAIHASHYGTGPLLILSGQGNVGIGTDDPNSKLTVVGVVSTNTPAGYSSELTNTSDVWYQTSVSLQSNSGNWDSTFTNVRDNSANWSYQGADLKALTGNYNSTFTNVRDNSANWDSTYTTFRNQSASFLTSYIETQTLSFDTNTKDLTLNGGSTPSTVSLVGIGGGSDVSGLSGKWENTYTTVNANSSSWSGGSAIAGVSGKWESSSNTVGTNSAKWSDAYTTLNSKSATWDTAAAGAGADAAVRALTGKWEGTSTTVQNNSSNWSDTYTTVKNNSSSWVDQSIIAEGTFGTATAVPRLTINNAGKITSVSEQTITPAAINAAAATHTHTTSQITNFAADVKTAASVNANLPNEFAKVGSNGLLPSTILPAGVDAIQEYLTRSAFPVTGASNIIYLALDTSKVYRWGGSTYTEIVASPGTTTNVPEGSNLYYTTARVQQDAPVKSVNNKTGIISLTYADVSAVHTHAASDITGFDTAADARVQAVKGNVNPLMNGVAAIGNSTLWAPINHVHPTDTSRAPLESPSFTGTVTIPTLNVTTIQGNAVTNAVQAAAATTPPIASDGTAALIGTSPTWAHADHKHGSDSSKASLTGATFTGTVVIPTLTVNTSIGGNGFTASTSAVVVSLSGTDSPTMNGSASVGTSNKWSPQDHVHPTDTSRAPIASPTFNGTVKAPTVSATTLYGNLLPGITTQTSSFTLAASDAGTIIRCDSSSTIYVTIPVDFASLGTQIILVGIGSGIVQILPSAGVTLLSVENKVSLSNQKSVASLICIANNEWLFAGDIN